MIKLLPIAIAVAFLLGFAGLVPALRPWSPWLLLACLAATWLLHARPTRVTVARLATRYAFEVWLALIAAVGAVILLLGAPLALQDSPLDIDENRLAATVRTFFTDGVIPYETVEDYPGLHYWQLVGLTVFKLLASLKSGLASSIHQIPNWQLVLLGRQLNAVMFGGIVVLTGLIGRRMLPPAWALGGAVLVAISPLGLTIAGQHRNETTLVALMTATLLATIVARTSAAAKPLLAAGLLAGLAAGVKYTGVFALVPAVMVAVTSGDIGRRCRRLATVVSVAAGAFLITQPFVLLDFPNFVVQLQTEVAMTGSGHWASTDNPSLFYTASLARSFGIPLLLAAAFGALSALRRRDADVGLLLGLMVPYQLFMTGQPSQFERWVYPLVPSVALLATVGLHEFVIAGSRRLSRSTAVATTVVVLAVAAMTPLYGAAQLLRLSLVPTTYDWLDRWRLENSMDRDLWLLPESFMSRWQGSRFVRARQFELLLDGRSPIPGAFDWVLVPESIDDTRVRDALAPAVRIEAYEGGTRRAAGWDLDVMPGPAVELSRQLDVDLGGPRAARLLGDGWQATDPSGGRLATWRAWLVVPVARTRPLSLQFDFITLDDETTLSVAIDGGPSWPADECTVLDAPSGAESSSIVAAEPVDATVPVYRRCAWILEPVERARPMLVHLEPQGFPLVLRVGAQPVAPAASR